MARWTAFLAVAAMAGLGAAYAQDEGFDRTPIDCISVNRLTRTEVLDDRTIVFYQRGGRVFRNYLVRDCPGLGREGRFAYEIRGGRLCDVDTITVLERVGPGFTCRLGQFVPITVEELEELRVGPAQQIEVTPVDGDEEQDEATAPEPPAEE